MVSNPLVNAANLAAIMPNDLMSVPGLCEKKNKNSDSDSEMGEKIENQFLNDFGGRIVWKLTDSNLVPTQSDLSCWRKISHDQQSCWQVMRHRLCQRTEETLYEGSGFCCEFCFRKLF